MIRIQHLKEPKKTSGVKLESGKGIRFKEIQIINYGKNPVYVDFYKRKKWIKKAEAKK